MVVWIIFDTSDTSVHCLFIYLFIYLILYFKRVTQLAISYSSLRPSLKQQQQYVQYIQNYTVMNIVIKQEIVNMYMTTTNLWCVLFYQFRSASGQINVVLTYGFPTFDESNLFVCSRTNKKNTQFIFFALVRIPSRALVALVRIPSRTLVTLA